MVLAAGLGTRLRPLTDTKPKALIPVGGTPLLKRVMLRLKAAGATRVVVNVHHFPEQIRAYIEANGCFGLDVRISDETEKLLDTGGGLRKAARLFNDDEPILIHNVDIISDADLASLYSQASMAASPTAGVTPAQAVRQADAVLLVSPRKTTRNLIFDSDMRLTGWINTATGEKRGPAATTKQPMPPGGGFRTYAFSGIHVFSPRLFKLMDTFPDKFGIMDFYLKVCGEAVIKGRASESLRLVDAGKASTLAEAEQLLADINEPS